MALLHLATDWAARHGTALSVATVDHRLRPGSADEARTVAGLCEAMGMPHRTLVWEGRIGGGNLQDAAREARRALLTGWATGQGVGMIATGHTLDDQAETVLLRLARGSGVDGLAGIAPARRIGGVLWVRPLLRLRRENLRHWLRDRGARWIDDPSNDDPRFDRVRARGLSSALADLGLTPGRLAAQAAHMRGARDVLETAADDLSRRAVRQEGGDLLFDRAVMMVALPETRNRLVARATMWISGAPYRPRFAALERLALTGRGTLQGCVAMPAGRWWRLTREYAAVRDTRCATAELWDDRWRMSGPHASDLHIAALGREGLARCDVLGMDTALAATPAVWRGRDLVSAPCAGYLNGWSASLSAGRDVFAP